MRTLTNMTQLPPYLRAPDGTTLLRYLARIIKAYAEDKSVPLIEIAADQPPNDAFRILLMLSDGKRYPVEFAPELAIVRHMRVPTGRKVTVTLLAHVIEAVSDLASPDPTER